MFQCLYKLYNDQKIVLIQLLSIGTFIYKNVQIYQVPSEIVIALFIKWISN